MSAPTARILVVHGLVQGVFFRDSTRRQALAHGVVGWVRNEPDGTVRAHVEGDPEAVERLVDWARQGPPHAVVERLDVTETSPEGHRTFTVR
jgi:acylphosphatase